VPLQIKLIDCFYIFVQFTEMVSLCFPTRTFETDGPLEYPLPARAYCVVFVRQSSQPILNNAFSSSPVSSC